MTQTCAYCNTEHDVSETVFATISHGFGHANKETRKFCSVECRTWWRRRESDRTGAWEQPGPVGYQARLDRYVADDRDDTDADESATQPATITASETASVEAKA
ncbi:hypothetical protein [Halococcus sp. PRR34]|uniref:hypothetical protein n=1 Tax=Halococcus sp. PRR34 TaxID=3020830 RepID=UPI0023612C82|nr:hypothetical protein [Halococcus sp. PRR34]